MITLITGTPGDGKTLRAMALLEAALKEGRECFSDIDGCTLPGVAPAPEDWRTLPHGAFVVYDEVHQRWPSTGRPGTSGNPIIVDLDQHRHSGKDFVLVTQYPTKVHHEVRQMVGRHEHVTRLSGASVATIFKWPSANLSPNDRQERDRADSEVWRYPKHLYAFYKSATLHTSAYRFRVPTKMKLIFAVVGIIAAAVVWRVSHSDGMLGKLAGVSDGGGAGSEAPPAAAPSVVGSSRVTQGDGWLGTVGGCIASVRACRCFDEKGAPIIEIQDHQCREYTVNPIFQPVRLNTKKGDA